MYPHHAAAFRVAPPDLQPIIAILALRDGMGFSLRPRPLAIEDQRPDHAKHFRLELVKDGPKYPNLGATVAKYRRIENPTPEQRREHGLAVLKAIGALQWRESQSCLTPVPSMKAQTPAELMAAGRAAMIANLRRCPGNVATEEQYEAAMVETRKARAAAKRKEARATKKAA